MKENDFIPISNDKILSQVGFWSYSGTAIIDTSTTPETIRLVRKRYYFNFKIQYKN